LGAEPSHVTEQGRGSNPKKKKTTRRRRNRRGGEEKVDWKIRRDKVPARRRRDIVKYLRERKINVRENPGKGVTHQKNSQISIAISSPGWETGVGKQNNMGGRSKGNLCPSHR